MARAPKASEETLPDSLDPVEMALDAGRDDDRSRQAARSLLINQNRLVRMQIASERMGVILKALTGVAGLLAAGALGVMVWNAAHDHSLIIEPFSTPPDLAAQGVTGQVLAVELLDKLASLDDQTLSLRRKASYGSSWSSDAKVEIPSTGVSIGELERLLRSWLGHQVRISGELVRLPDKDGKPGGLALTVRAGSTAGVKVVSDAGDIDQLLGETAVNLYRQSQPYRYFIYASRVGKRDDAEAVLKKQTGSEDRRERAWAWSGLSSFHRQADPARAEGEARRSLAEIPGFAPATGNLGLAAEGADHPEAALNALRRSASLFLKSPDVDPELGRFNHLNALLHVAILTGDYRAALAENEAIDELSQALGDTDTLTQDIQRAELLIRLHTPLAGERALPAGLLAKAPLAARDLWITDRREREDWAGVIAAAAPIIEGSLPLSEADRVYWLRFMLPNVAYARARSGDLAGARALIDQAPADGYRVMIAQGEIAAIAGDAAAADRWFAQAVRSAPSIAGADLAWGRALLARGQTDAAIARFAQAAAKAPHDADAESLWGEALLAKGDARGAESRFRAADAIAPRWGRNHLLWGEALSRLGGPGEARTHWRAAWGMDLTPADRARLQALLAAGR